MKQPISVIVLFVLIFSSLPLAVAQKGRVLSEKTLADQKPTSVQQTPEVVIAPPEAFTDGHGVFIRWHTERETGNVGFYVSRVEKGEKHVVGRFIGGSATHYGKETVYGESYSRYDPEGRSDSIYVIDSVLINGTQVSTGPVYTKFVGDLSKIDAAFSKQSAGDQLTPNGILIDNTPTISKELQVEIDSHATAPDPVMQKWVASRTGAKIGVRQTGMYRVTRAQLEAAGFDVNSDPDMWQLYTDGNQQSISIGPNADYIEFYGKGIDTMESNVRMYYLVIGDAAGRRISSVGLRPSFRAETASGFELESSLKERANYVSTLLNGPATNFFGDVLFQGATATANLNLAAVDTTSSTARVAVRVQGFSGFSTRTLSVSLNGQTIGQMSGSGSASMVFDGIVPGSALVEGQNSVRLSCLVCGQNDFSFVDSVSVTYQRKYVADQNQLRFTTTPFFDTSIQGFTSSNVRVFDITNDGDPIQLTGLIVSQNGDGYDAFIHAYGNSAMFAVEDSAMLSPASVSGNDPSTLSTTNHNADLVIISYKDFLTQANAWADYRRGQGVQVEVVSVEDIYDEFNYGVLSAQSLKDFLFYARNNWQTPPRYVLLIGDATYDPRLFEGPPLASNLNLVPAMLVDTLNEETASDDALVDFNNDGLAEMAIGRIPATSSDIVSNALSKTISFESQVATQNLSRGALFAYDNPIGYDFQAMSQRIANALPAGTTSVLVGRSDTNPNAMLIAEMNNGRYLVNFSGHGTTGSWASSSNFQLGHVPLLTNINNLSIFTMLTCLNGYFVSTRNITLGERLLNASNGGAVASWASSGTTTPDIQELMGTRFYSQIGLGNITRLGDLIVDAKTVVPGGHDVRLSWVLLGDPMLKVR